MAKKKSSPKKDSCSKKCGKKCNIKKCDQKPNEEVEQINIKPKNKQAYLFEMIKKVLWMS